MAQDTNLTQEERTFGMLVHLAALVLFVVPSFGNIIGPLVVWLLKKDQSAWIDRQGKKALNFQISIVIYTLVVFVLMFILVLTVVGIPLAVFLALGLLFFWLAMVVIASVKVQNGEDFNYPLSIPFLQ